MRPTPIQVVLVDDHPFVRRGLRETLEDAGITVIAETEDGPRALALLRTLWADGDHLDVLLLDVNMPGLDGFEVLSRVRAEMPDLSVLVLSMHPESEVALAALRAGASGYIEKRATADSVVEAVRQVASGRRYLSDALAERFADAALSGSLSSTTALSPRELQVVRGVAAGLTRKEIADTLGVSPATVTTFKGRASKKLGARTDAEIARHAFATGLAVAPRTSLP